MARRRGRLPARTEAGFRPFGALLCAALASSCVQAKGPNTAGALDAGLNAPANFELEGRPFCFAGANNYYLASKPAPMVDDVLLAAKALNLPVVRMWAFLDIGSLDGSVPHVDPWGDKRSGKKDGVYFQYFDPASKRVLYNEGSDGLPKLDYVLAKAADVGIKLILVLTNNWRDFGGMDQYLRWFGRTKHHEFYTAPEVKQVYKDWVEHLVQRKNSVNGRMYRDDPTIFAWELGNEPRCHGTGGGAPGWDNRTLVDWADEMSRYIHSLDPNHMVSVGDEGFLNGGGEHWAYKARDGVDHEALTALSGIDFGTFHAYPRDWGASLAWGDGWIAEHTRVARRLGKPTILEEYGVKVRRNEAAAVVENLGVRLRTYRRWNDVLLRGGGNASLVWMLGGRDTLYPAPNGLYKDHDGYTVYRGDASTTLLASVAQRFLDDAPACRVGKQPSGARSPFVRAERAQSTEPVAMGWATFID